MKTWISLHDCLELKIYWSELRYPDLHRRSASVNHVVTNVASVVSNCNTHKCSIVRRQERSIRSFAMSIAKHLMWFTSLTVTSAGSNAKEKVSNHSTEEWMDTEVILRKKRSCPWVNTLCPRDTHWMTLVDPKFISLTTIQVGKRINDKKERVFGSAS